MEKSITRFIERQTSVTLCCVDEEGKPHCFTCFYAFEKSTVLLHFKTSPESRHMKLLSKKIFVSGAILQDRLRIYAIEGIQLFGELLPADHFLAEEANKKYHRKFPFALALAGKVYTIQLHEIKMSSWTRSGRKKINWHRD